MSISREPFPRDASDNEWSLAVLDYATWSAMGPLGERCRMTCHHGVRCISRRSAGLRRAVSKRWRRTCGLYCAWLRGARRNKKGSKLHVAVDTLGHLWALLSAAS